MDESAAEELGQDPRSLFCRTSNTTPGLMIGVHGGVALAEEESTQTVANIVSNDGGIGSFLMVCAPFSAVSYTENWRFVEVRGAQVARELDTLGGQWGWGQFDEYMSRVYEERGNGTDAYVRPASAKLCPPNYLLRGVGLSSNGSHYTGVTNLYCFDANNEDQVTVPLKADSATYNYKMRGASFSLSQLIGEPECGNECFFRGCKVGDAMFGMKTVHDAQGRLIYFEPHCTTAP